MPKMESLFFKAPKAQQQSVKQQIEIVKMLNAAHGGTFTKRKH